MENKNYIEITRFSDKVVVKRMDVTGYSKPSIDRIENGINRNLNHDKYFTKVKEHINEMPESDDIN